MSAGTAKSQVDSLAARAALSASVVNMPYRLPLQMASAQSSLAGCSYRVTYIGDGGTARTVGDTGVHVWRMIF